MYPNLSKEMQKQILAETILLKHDPFELEIDSLNNVKYLLLASKAETFRKSFVS